MAKRKTASKKFIHDPDCAVIKDVAPSENWDDPDYRPPACTCKERQEARKRYVGATSGHSFEDFTTAGRQSLGEGNFRAWAKPHNC